MATEDEIRKALQRLADAWSDIDPGEGSPFPAVTSPRMKEMRTAHTQARKALER